MWRLVLWTVLRTWSCDYIQGWIHFSKRSIVKTSSNGDSTIRSTFSSNTCSENACRSSWPPCTGKGQAGQQGRTGTLRHQWTLCQGGEPACLRRASAGTFGCLNRLEQMFVCCREGIKCFCVKTLARETNVCFYNRHLDCWNITTYDIGLKNIYLIWEAPVRTEHRADTNWGFIVVWEHGWNQALSKLTRKTVPYLACCWLFPSSGINQKSDLTSS